MNVSNKVKVPFILLLVAGIYGCTGQTPAAPVQTTDMREPVAVETSGPSPSVPSKGTGIKKKTPVTVKAGDRLGWVDNALKTYPPDRFLTGLGIAPDRRTAEHRSLMELEKPFIRAIAGRIKLQKKAMGTIPRKLESEMHALAEKCSQNSLQTLRLRTRVAEVFIETAPAATVYALAVLDRQTCVDQLRSSIHRLDAKLKQVVSRIENPGSTQSTDNTTLLNTFVCREGFDAALAAVAPDGKGIDLSVPSESIGRLLRKNN